MPPSLPTDMSAALIEKTLHFDNAREAHAITGHSPGLIARMEQVLGVKLTPRSAWLRLEGPAPAVEQAGRFFESLRAARDQGAWLQEQAIVYALRAIEDGHAAEWEELLRLRIEVGPGKPAVFPRTFGQKRYLQAIMDQDIAFGIGPAGTGKTYLAMATAVAGLLRQEVSRIILTRPALEAGEALGYLPGDMLQKVAPYLRPLYDALYDMMAAEDIERHMARGVIEVAPLAYMRGRTLNHAFVILDEAQNTTTEQMLMFLTRLGFDSKCVITGDLTQVDLPPHKTSGLQEARQILSGEPGIALVELGDEDVVRHPLVQRIIQAYRAARSSPPGRGPNGAARPA